MKALGRSNPVPPPVLPVLPPFLRVVGSCPAGSLAARLSSSQALFVLVVVVPHGIFKRFAAGIFVFSSIEQPAADLILKVFALLEDERRAADLAHRESVHRAMLDALKSHGIPDKYAIDVVSLLRSSAIPFVTIKY